MPNEPALNGSPQRDGPGLRGHPQAFHEGTTDTASNAQGASAVNGFLRALSALLVPHGGRARRQRGKVARWTTSTIQFSAALSSAVDAARRADRHVAEVPARANIWSLPTLLLVMATLTAADYFGVNAILRAANLPQRASLTLPLVISLTLLISAKVLALWDLGSVAAGSDRVRRSGVNARESSVTATGGSDTQPHVSTPVDAVRGLPDDGDGGRYSAAYDENARRLEELAGPVRARKRAVLRIIGPLMALGVLGLFIGLGGLGSQLGGGLGLNDGEHDGLLLLCTFGVISGIVLMNVAAAFALAYGTYVPGAGEYRAAVRNAQAKWIYVRFLSATARPERKSRRLLETLRAVGERADVRAALGHHEGMREALLAEPGTASTQAKNLVDRLGRQLTDQTPRGLHEAYEERLARLERHLSTIGSVPASGARSDGAGDGNDAGVT